MILMESPEGHGAPGTSANPGKLGYCRPRRGGAAIRGQALVILMDLPGDHMVPGTSTSDSDGIAGRSWGPKPTISIQFSDSRGILKIATGRSSAFTNCHRRGGWHLLTVTVGDDHPAWMTTVRPEVK